MGSYIRMIFLSMLMVFVIVFVVDYSAYYVNVTQLKQDIYKDIFYDSVNKGSARLNGVDTENIENNFDPVEVERAIHKHIAFGMNTNIDNIKYKVAEMDHEYYLYLESDNVKTVTKIEIGE